MDMNRGPRGPGSDCTRVLHKSEAMMAMSTSMLGVIGLQHYLVLSAILFGCGVTTLMVKRNAIGILIGVELILNAANINLVAFNHYLYAHSAGEAGPASLLFDGQIFALFVIVLAAAEAAVALAIFLNFYNNFSTIDVEPGQNLKG